MVPLDSVIEEKIYPLHVLEDLLKPEGFVIGSNWDYDGGHFDLKMDDQGIYYFLRIPFYAVAGSLDYPGVTVRVEKPFLLAHQYEADTDREGINGPIQGTFNQFQSPVDKDANVPDRYVYKGREILEKVEQILVPGSE
ncbi:YugN family protein [Oceanobacillus halotolerans]|uniref:YugN family protein n=1 Tax=Oceanobacillus halotolerans TaxID=2663380 RepID=UPI0013D966E5|nr:YugN family protein [Oceanobacillus halotolerans]